MGNDNQVFMAFSVWVAAAVIPLIPATVIYKLFPETKVSAEGPLSGLTINTSGAFAVYVIVFVLTATLPYKVIELIEANGPAAWNVVFKGVDLVGSSGKTIDDPELTNRTQISVAPEFFMIKSSGGWVKVPETDGKLPTIMFTVPGRGFKEIDLAREIENSADVEVDKARHVITLRSPITLRIHEDKTPYAANGETPQPVAGALLPP